MDDVKKEVIKIKMTKEEWDTTVVLSPAINGVKNRTAYVDTTCPADYSALMRKHWKLVKQYVYEDGTVCGGVFEASANYLTFRDTKSLRRELSDEERMERRERLRKNLDR